MYGLSHQARKNGQEKWADLKTYLLSVARNRMKEHIEAAQRQSITGDAIETTDPLTWPSNTSPPIRRCNLKPPAVPPNRLAGR